MAGSGSGVRNWAAARRRGTRISVGRWRWCGAHRIFGSRLRSVSNGDWRMLEHGGRLLEASRRYGIAIDQWLDLSTGISPFAYPVPSIAPELWRRLPDEEDDLVAAAAAYYGSRQCLAVPGTQAALQVLPRILAARRVAVLNPSYAEYAHVWARAGCEVASVPEGAMGEAAKNFGAVVLCNPNNPDGYVFTCARLAHMRAQLAARGGWLVVDQPYADTPGGGSVAGAEGAAGVFFFLF